MYTVQNKTLIPLFSEINGLKEPYNRCRQELPQTYIHNGYIDIFNSNIIISKKSITGNNIYSYIMNKDEYHDIDTLKDWEEAEKK